ncbi:MAG: lysophospholipase L2 [Bdellovibrio sp.]
MTSFHQKPLETFCRRELLDLELTGVGGLLLHLLGYTQESNQNLLVISPGRTEAAVKYVEWIYDLKDSGYDIWAIDHRGQGLSGRMLEDTHKGHVEQFEDYITDFVNILTYLKQQKKYKKVIVMAHSMGGAIASSAGMKRKGLYDAIILSAPMLHLKLKGFPSWVARIYFWFLCLLKEGHLYALSRDKAETLAAFKGNRVTHDRDRYEFYRAQQYHQPLIQMGGPTNNWVYQASSYVSNYSEEQKLNVPILCFLAGDDDYVVNRSIEKYVSAWSDHSQIIKFPKSYHELFMEDDSVRQVILIEVRRFLSRFL